MCSRLIKRRPHPRSVLNWITFLRGFTETLATQHNNALDALKAFLNAVPAVRQRSIEVSCARPVCMYIFVHRILLCLYCLIVCFGSCAALLGTVVRSGGGSKCILHHFGAGFRVREYFTYFYVYNHICMYSFVFSSICKYLTVYFSADGPRASGR